MIRFATTLRAALGLAALLAALPLRAETIALLPVQDRAGDSAVVRAVTAALSEAVAAEHQVLDPGELRDALRRRRIRRVDDTPPAELRELAAEVGADRFLTVVVHLAERDVTPRLALSARSYDAGSGTVGWAGFESGSGLDGRTLLGLGVVTEIETLAVRLTRRLVAGLPPAGGGETPAAGPGLGVVAIVPFSGLAASDATRASETATEIARAALGRLGVEVLSPNRTFEALYGRRGEEPLVGWGAVDATTRRLLRESGADWIVTGAVERWETAGDGFEPEPVVTLALRAVDAESGRIVWTGALDRRGWDGQTVFRLGRVWDHGTLGQRMIRRLTERMTADLAELRSAADPGRTTP